MSDLVAPAVPTVPSIGARVWGIALLVMLAVALPLAATWLLVEAAPANVLEGITWPALQIAARAPGS